MHSEALFGPEGGLLVGGSAAGFGTGWGIGASYRDASENAGVLLYVHRRSSCPFFPARGWSKRRGVRSGAAAAERRIARERATRVDGAAPWGRGSRGRLLGGVRFRLAGLGDAGRRPALRAAAPRLQVANHDSGGLGARCAGLKTGGRSRGPPISTGASATDTHPSTSTRPGRAPRVVFTAVTYIRKLQISHS